jgi:hypothetical protein
VNADAVNYALVKAIAVVPCAVVWSDGARAWLGRKLPSHPVAAVTAAAAMRFGLAALAFEVLGLKIPSDAAGFYATFARDVLQTGVASSPYSPGFNDLLAGISWLFGSPMGFVWTFITVEVAALGVLAHLAKATPIWEVVIFWIVNPLSLYFVTLGAQDEPLLLLFWCLTLWMVVRRRPALGGLLAGLGVAMTKILGGFAVLPTLLLPRRQAVLSLIVAGCAVAAAVGVCWQLHVPVLGFLNESRLVTSGNVWAIVAFVGSGAPAGARVWQMATAVAAVGAALIWLERRPLASPIEQALRVLGVVGAMFLALMPKSFTEYTIIFLPGLLWLTLQMPRRWRQASLYLFLPACVVEPSVWFMFGEGRTLAATWWARPAMIALDTAVVGGYVALAVRGLSIRGVVRSDQAARAWTERAAFAGVTR